MYVCDKCIVFLSTHPSFLNPDPKNLITLLTNCEGPPLLPLLPLSSPPPPLCPCLFASPSLSSSEIHQRYTSVHVAGKDECCMKSVTFDLLQICGFSIKGAPEMETNKIKGRTSEKPQESPLPLYHHPLGGGSSWFLNWQQK